VAIINGRLSDKSFRGYRRLRPLAARVLRQVDLIAAQNEETAERFRKLGASYESVQTTGSLKFDGAQTDRDNPRTAELHRLAGLVDGEPVLLVGSTQAPEEEYALTVLERLSRDYPTLRLIVVPRHPERFAEVAELVAASGLACQRRSALETTSSSRVLTDRRWSVLLVDTIGELGAWWGTATLGFVGGSFGSRGGQNMLEPAAYGVATCFGPNTWNFRDIVGQLLAAEGAMVVQDAHDLEAFVRRALSDPTWAKALGQRARNLVASQQGATRRTVQLLRSLSRGAATSSDRRAA
jgi:3-deoxy-D-manno-octulosonic-acid transferase